MIYFLIQICIETTSLPAVQMKVILKHKKNKKNTHKNRFCFVLIAPGHLLLSHSSEASRVYIVG